MTAFLLLTALFGSLVGTRFQVLCLVPLTVALLGIVSAVGAVLGADFVALSSTAVLAATVLQMGYVAGASAHYAIQVARAPRISQLRSRIPL